NELSGEPRSSTLRELEPLSGALLSVLLPLFAASIAADHAFRLQLLAQLSIELHQRTSYAQFHGIRLAIDAAAGNRGDHVEAGSRFGRKQRLPRARTLRLGYEILFKRAPVDLEVSAARTQKHAGHRRLTPPGSVVLD